MSPEVALGFAKRLGCWLRDTRYVGIDVSVTNEPAMIGTVPAFAMLGWLNLADLAGEAEYLALAEEALGDVLSEQTSEGCWLFPYAFRSNPACFAYSCENFMTVECLLEYGRRMRNFDRVAAPVRHCLDCLLSEVGHQNGVFWYSAADRICVPNISSMAARVFAEVSQELGAPDYRALSLSFARYCVSQQADTGAYPYFQDDAMVYVPYHALETWELAKANSVLGDAEIQTSVGRAIAYLRDLLSRRGYASRDDGAPRGKLLKTPLWAAKAFLSTGHLEEAWTHVNNGLRLFGLPGGDCCFYNVDELCGIEVPVFASCFARYNASAFEICTSVLRGLGRLPEKEKQCLASG